MNFHPINIFYKLKRIFYKYKKFKFTPQKLAKPLGIMDFVYLLNDLYKDRSGFESELNREDYSLTKQNIYLTYGEIMPEGLKRLFDFINPTEHDSFVDLGSGAGKSVLQGYLCTDIRSSYGVEIDGARYRVSQEVLEDLFKKVPDLKNKHKKAIEFENINMTDFDFNKVTLVFANSICNGPHLMEILENKINSSPYVRAVFTTKRMDNLKNLPKFKIIPVETSWHMPPNKSNCYVYYK